MDDLTQQTVWIHFHFSIKTSSGQQREVKGFLPIGPSRQSSHKCLKSNVLQKNQSSSSSNPPGLHLPEIHSPSDGVEREPEVPPSWKGIYELPPHL